MGESAASLDATADALNRASFATVDVLRRALGHALGAFGLDPDECPYRIVGFGPHWRLRDYGGHDRSLSLLIIATPIKRAYIWDLAPFVSAVRYCMQAGLHVHLLEWLPASDRKQNNGLDEYTEAISECVAKISCRAAGTTPFLVGHSLGGTLAAIFTALAPASIRGLILLGAPLCFEPATSSIPGRPRRPDSAGAVRWRPFSRVATIIHRHPSVSQHIYMVEGDRHCLEHHRPSDAGNQCPDRALGSRRGPSFGKAGAPNCPVALSREPLMSRNLEGQRYTCGSIQPVSSSARDCNHGRRGGPACLSQTFYRRHASNGCAYHSISRRGWDWVAASRNSGRPPGTRTRLARNHLLDQDPLLKTRIGALLRRAISPCPQMALSRH